MNYFSEFFTKPYIKDNNYKTILEIGASLGENSNKLLSIKDICLTIIDPCMDNDLLNKFKDNERVSVLKGLSLQMLPKLTEPFDCIFIDGDHNWYTVTNELRLIEERNLLKEGGSILLHDILWPYGRRDMYYIPESIPEKFRHPYAKRGIVEGQSRTVEKAGTNQDLFNATFEGGNRNGILTAVEDFLSKSHGKYILFSVNEQYGLGILVKKRNIAHSMMCLKWMAKILYRKVRNKGIHLVKKIIKIDVIV